MKRILTITAIIFAACSSVQQSATLTSAAQIANSAGMAYQTYASAQTGTLTAGQVSTALQTASDDLNGIAALSQAYVGSGQTPATANIQTGAKNLSVASQVVAKLPNVPITQATAAQLFQAAELVTASSPANTQAFRVKAIRLRERAIASLPPAWLGWSSPVGIPAPTLFVATK